MLYYYLFWMIMGFIIHFYITFGTNLLTGGLAPIAVLLLVSVFRRKGISNGVQMEWNQLFLEWKQSRRLGVHVRESTRRARGRGRALHPRGPLVAPLTDFFRLYISIYPKNIGEHNRLGVPPPQASVATKNQSGPCSGTLPGGIHHRWPSSSSRRSPWRGGSSSPSGLRVCTSSYVFDLSLSCSWGGTILMYRELWYYSWILWCFSPSTLL